jgi:hypothetical protein
MLINMINLLCGNTATEHGSDCKIAVVAGISSAHHVLGFKHLSTGGPVVAGGEWDNPDLVDLELPLLAQQEGCYSASKCHCIPRRISGLVWTL